MHHNLKERKKRTEKKERRITHYKIDNNLNGLEKYSFIFGHVCTECKGSVICAYLIQANFSEARLQCLEIADVLVLQTSCELDLFQRYTAFEGERKEGGREEGREGRREEGREGGREGGGRDGGREGESEGWREGGR